MPHEGLEHIALGQVTRFRKTVGETDVYIFAGITGDLYANHVDEQYMRTTRYGRRIAHGALLVGYMSAASVKLLDGLPNAAVSYGYDRIRFVHPVFLGDTVTVTCTVVGKNPDKDQVILDVQVTNQDDEVVAVATHLLKFV